MTIIEMKEIQNALWLELMKPILCKTTNCVHFKNFFRKKKSIWTGFRLICGDSSCYSELFKKNTISWFRYSEDDYVRVSDRRGISFLSFWSFILSILRSVTDKGLFFLLLSSFCENYLIRTWRFLMCKTIVSELNSIGNESLSIRVSWGFIV